MYPGSFEFLPRSFRRILMGLAMFFLVFFFVGCSTYSLRSQRGNLTLEASGNASPYEIQSILEAGSGERVQHHALQEGKDVEYETDPETGQKRLSAREPYQNGWGGGQYYGYPNYQVGRVSPQCLGETDPVRLYACQQQVQSGGYQEQPRYPNEQSPTPPAPRGPAPRDHRPEPSTPKDRSSEVEELQGKIDSLMRLIEAQNGKLVQLERAGGDAGAIKKLEEEINTLRRTLEVFQKHFYERRE